MLRTKLIAVSVAIGLLLTGFFPFTEKECYIPSPAAHSVSGGESFGSLSVVKADEVEFSFKLLEWLRELF